MAYWMQVDRYSNETRQTVISQFFATESFLYSVFFWKYSWSREQPVNAVFVFTCCIQLLTSSVDYWLVDVNECSQSGICNNGQCVNVEGSFRCICSAGYKLSSDGTYCSGVYFSTSSYNCWITCRLQPARRCRPYVHYIVLLDKNLIISRLNITL